jgi:hypothetical protein
LLPLLPTLTWLFLFNSCKYVIPTPCFRLILDFLANLRTDQAATLRT